MYRILIFLLLVGFTTGLKVNAQELPQLKLKNNSIYKHDNNVSGTLKSESGNLFQVKKRKAVNMYFGAGYSFVIFTSGFMNDSYPVFNQTAGDFLSEINLFFGFAVAKALTLEFEPSVLFTNNTKLVTFTFSPPRTIDGVSYTYANTGHQSMLAFPIALNARFFPFYKQDKSFIRLFFLGAGGGMAWIREENDNYYSNSKGIYYIGDRLITESTSQWAPILRVMTGFTGSGGMFGFGGELRFNFIPLKTSNDGFATRQSKNFNSVDLALRFYFSL